MAYHSNIHRVSEKKSQYTFRYIFSKRGTSPDHIVHGIQVWAVGWPKTWRDEVQRFLAQKGDSFTRFVTHGY